MRRLKVLPAGLSELGALVRDALLLWPHSTVAIVTNHRNLCSSSRQRKEFELLDRPLSSRVEPAELLKVVDRLHAGVADEPAAWGADPVSARVDDGMSCEVKMASKVLLWCLLLAAALLICTQ
jgi:hypothetical protein